MRAGALATGLYVTGVLINPNMPSNELLTTGTITRGVTFITIGALIGWFASHHRAMVAELRPVRRARRAHRAAEYASLRVGDHEAPRPPGSTFALLVADMDALKDFNRDEGFTAGNDALRRLADRLATSLGPDDDIARVGSNEFAILASVPSSEGSAQLAARLERMLAEDRTKATVGWTTFPHEGDNALALYRAASERLYARKVMRSYLRPVPEPVDAGRG